MRHLSAIAAASAGPAIAGCGSDSPRSELRLQNLDALIVSDILVEGGDAACKRRRARASSAWSPWGCHYARQRSQTRILL